MKHSIGFIGGGRIVRILVSAIARKGYDLAKIAFCESSDEAAAELQGEFPAVRRLEQAELAAVSDILFVALPPAAIAGAIGSGRLAPRLDSIVLSVAPKVALRDIIAMLGGFDRVARMIPNAPSIIGAGYNPVSYGSALTDADRRTLGDIFSAFGEFPEVDEPKLEAYAVLTAMGPTYFLYQIYELMRLASGFGLDEEEIREAARAMLAGMIGAAFDSGLTPERVLDLIPSKPMARNEAVIKGMYESALNGIYAKLKS
jgi:pyrroline-5-carboxylate reductase